MSGIHQNHVTVSSVHNGAQLQAHSYFKASKAAPLLGRARKLQSLGHPIRQRGGANAAQHALRDVRGTLETEEEAVGLALLEASPSRLQLGQRHRDLDIERGL